MVGAKPSAYLSEEARLQAQRRMLAERYGLSMSDDEDEESSPPPPSSSSASTKTPDRAKSKSIATKRAVSPEESNGRAGTSSNSSSGSRSGQSGDNLADTGSTAVPDDRVAGVRALEKDPAPGADKAGQADKKDAAKNALAQPWLLQNNAVSPLWPGVVIADTDNTRTIPRVFTYNRSEHRDIVAKRSLRVTQVTVYASQFVETDGRKIAVNDRVITYVVGGHIRAIVRTSALLALLKGHLASVIDTEFLSPNERLISGPWTGCSVLGSVSEDGTAFIWRLLRNDAADNGFKVADAIPITHLKAEEGRKFSRISFRPGLAGSVVADNGIGVVMCLVDLSSPDLLVAEMVKMDGDVMVRRKYLRCAEEPRPESASSLLQNTPVSSCAWMDEEIIVVSRGENVYIWEFDEPNCIGKLPRTAKSKVHSLHAIEDNVLLVAVDGGRSIEVWIVENCLESAPVCRLNQTINLCPGKPAGATSKNDGFHGVIAMDPKKEVVIVANAKGNFLFALHYNQMAKAIDAITEIPTKSPVFSISVTRNAAKKAQYMSVGGAEPILGDEIGLWCVQPKVIQMVHLNPKNCAPSAQLSRQLSLSPKNASTNKTESPPDRQAEMGTAKAVVPEEGPRKPTGILKLPVPEKPAQRPPLQRVAKPASIAKKLDVQEAKEDPNNAASRAEQVKGDDIVDAVLEATKRVIDSFEKAAEQRDAAENARVEKLISKVKAQTEAQLTVFVDAAMKKPMADTIVPKVSKIIIDMQKGVKNAEAQRGKVSEKLFAQALEQSNVAQMFKAGCEEIFDQIAVAVEKSMAAKGTRLVNPPVKHIVSTTANLTKVTNEFVKRVESVSATGLVNRDTEKKPVDVREEAEVLLKAKKMNDAFLIVLNEGNLELVSWLCRRFDPKTFFETNSLSQVAVLSLAQQLGQGLGASDSVNIVEWLRELMLVLEPTDEDIVDVVGQTLAELRTKVALVQKEPELLRQHPGLAKQLKTLNLVLYSLAH